jgi:peptidoglycan/xylan/chitin deacetylase (PgdA/CDA1 family)
MAQFEARGAKATFLVTGNHIGKGYIDENWADVISKMYANGHQIASHTWSHQNLDLITHEQRIDEMVKNEMAIRNIIGKYPTYMRPPYSGCASAVCQADMASLGYVVTSFDLDTDDYNQLTTEKIQVAKDSFRNCIDVAGADGDRLPLRMTSTSSLR